MTESRAEPKSLDFNLLSLPLLPFLPPSLSLPFTSFIMVLTPGQSENRLIQYREILSVVDSIQFTQINENVTGSQKGKESSRVTASQVSLSECKAMEPWLHFLT